MRQDEPVPTVSKGRGAADPLILLIVSLSSILLAVNDMAVNGSLHVCLFVTKFVAVAYRYTLPMAHSIQ